MRTKICIMYLSFKNNILFTLNIFLQLNICIHFFLFCNFKGDYRQNRCLMSDKSCVPCPSRLPSCIGLPDGQNPVVGFLWKSKYVVCYKNRTMGTGECPEGKYFHPRQRLCLHPVKPGKR